MAIKIGKVNYRVLTEQEAIQLLSEGILRSKEMTNLKTLYDLLTEASRMIIRRQFDDLDKIFSAAGRVYGKYREKYMYCLIPDPVVDIGLAYMHPTEGRTEAEARELMLIALQNIITLTKAYSAVTKEKVKGAVGGIAELKKKLQAKK